MADRTIRKTRPPSQELGRRERREVRMGRADSEADRSAGGTVEKHVGQ